EEANAKLSFAPEKYFYNITRYVNTSAACIQMMLDEANRAGKLKKGDYIAMAAFGGGLTSGSAVLRWNAE
ncbi:MAG: 3-oxoacyl-[acyl-carrier-protein] synthase III C-terminal domain-containing protein, partial [[Clostridium] leptum]